MRYNFTDALIEAYEPLCEEAEEATTIDLKANYPYITFSGDTNVPTTNGVDPEFLDTTIKAFTLTPEQENRIKSKLANLNLEAGSESYIAAWNKEIAKDKEIAKLKANYDNHAKIVTKWKNNKKKLAEGLYITEINLTKMAEEIMKKKSIKIDATTRLLIEEFFLYKIGNNDLYSPSGSSVGLERLAGFLNAEISEITVLSCLNDYDTQRAIKEREWKLTRTSIPPADNDGISADILAKGKQLPDAGVTVEVKVSNNTQTVGKSLWKAHKAAVVAAYLEFEESWVTFVKLSKNDNVAADKETSKKTVETNLPSYYTTSADISKIIDTEELKEFKAIVQLAADLQDSLTKSYNNMKLVYKSNIYKPADKTNSDYGSVTMFYGSNKSK